jgi:hypothetical protein
VNDIKMFLGSPTDPPARTEPLPKPFVSHKQPLFSKYQLAQML